MQRAALFLLLIIFEASCTAKTPAKPQHDFQPRPNYLTMGNPVAGRAIFLELKCNTCHTVAGERSDRKIPGPGGPELGTAEAFQTPDDIARSIATPGHAVSAKPGPWQEANGSRMADYASTMTVSQLMDLVAYILSLPHDPPDELPGWR